MNFNFNSTDGIDQELHKYRTLFDQKGNKISYTKLTGKYDYGVYSDNKQAMLINQWFTKCPVTEIRKPVTHVKHKPTIKRLEAIKTAKNLMYVRPYYLKWLKECPESEINEALRKLEIASHRKEEEKCNNN